MVRTQALLWAAGVARTLVATEPSPVHLPIVIAMSLPVWVGNNPGTVLHSPKQLSVKYIYTGVILFCVPRLSLSIPQAGQSPWDRSLSSRTSGTSLYHLKARSWHLNQRKWPYQSYTHQMEKWKKDPVVELVMLIATTFHERSIAQKKFLPILHPSQLGPWCTSSLWIPFHFWGPGSLIIEPQDKLIAGTHTRTLDLSTKISSLSIRTTLLLPRKASWTWGQDTCKGRRSSYPGPCKHPNVLSLRYSWKDWSVPCASICFFGSTLRVHKGFGPVCSDTLQQRDQSPYISRQLDHLCGLPRTESSAYAIDYPPFTNLWMDYQLQEAYTGNLTHTRLLGAALQSPTNNCFSSILLLDSHQCPSPSSSVQGHACMQDNLYKQLNLSLWPV